MRASGPYSAHAKSWVGGGGGAPRQTHVCVALEQAGFPCPFRVPVWPATTPVVLVYTHGGLGLHWPRRMGSPINSRDRCRVGPRGPTYASITTHRPWCHVRGHVSLGLNVVESPCVCTTTARSVPQVLGQRLFIRCWLHGASGTTTNPWV